MRSSLVRWLLRSLIPGLGFGLAGIPVGTPTAPWSNVVTPTARAVGWHHPLAFPPARHSLAPVFLAVDATVPVDDRVLTFAHHKSHYVEHPFSGPQATRTATFGDADALSRLSYPEEMNDRRVSGGLSANDTLVLLDGFAWRLFTLDRQDYTFRGVQKIHWQRIRPAADFGGEPTDPETAALRGRFRRALLVTDPERLVGIVQAPHGWLGQPGGYLVATRIPGFPLVTMRCDLADGCRLDRACFVENSPVPAHAVSGLGIHPASRSLYLGNTQDATLHRLRFDSCFHVPHTGYRKFPAKLEQLGRIATDNAGRLWATMRAANMYTNASIYFWQPDAWREPFAQR